VDLQSKVGTHWDFTRILAQGRRGVKPRWYVYEVMDLSMPFFVRVSMAVLKFLASTRTLAVLKVLTIKILRFSATRGALSDLTIPIWSMDVCVCVFVRGCGTTEKEMNTGAVT